MQKLKYFIIGFLTAEVGISLIDTIAGVVLQSLEVIKGKLQIQLAKEQVEFEAIKSGGEEGGSSNNIGFVVPSEEEEDYEGEDE